MRGRQEGVSAVEYGMMVAIIALLLVGGFILLYNNVPGGFQGVDCVGPSGAAGCPTDTSVAGH